MKNFFHHPTDKNLVASWRLAHLLSEDQAKLLPAAIKERGADSVSIRIHYGWAGVPKAHVQRIFSGWKPIDQVSKQSHYPLVNASLKEMKIFLDAYHQLSNGTDMVLAKSTCRLTKIPKLTPNPLLETLDFSIPTAPHQNIGAFNVLSNTWFDGVEYSTEAIYLVNDIDQLRKQLWQAYSDNKIDDPTESPLIYVHVDGDKLSCVSQSSHPLAQKAAGLLKENALKAVIEKAPRRYAARKL